MSQAHIGTYRTVQVATADPPALVLQLYDGAIRFLRQALRGLPRKDARSFAEPMSRAHAIIAQLTDSLDHEVGGEVADNLARLYGFMLFHLTQGLIERSRAHVEDVLGLLTTLKEGFEGATETVRRERRS